jgi:hypothetical protein
LLAVGLLFSECGKARMPISQRIVAVLAVAALPAACLTGEAHRTVELPAQYRQLPAGGPIERGSPVRLSPRQQEAVISSVRTWMKDGASAAFGEMSAARIRQGRITVCGFVGGRNSLGQYVGPSRFLGVLIEEDRTPAFVTVDIATSGTRRSTLEVLCRESGAT